MVHLEILRHSGPARLGFFHYRDKKITTPNIFSIVTFNIALPGDIYMAPPYIRTSARPLVKYYGSTRPSKEIDGFGFLPHWNAGFNAPYALAEAALEESLRMAGKHPDYPAVIGGGRYVSLRKRAAEELDGSPLLLVAHADRLVKNPRLLVYILTAIKETVSPNTALYASGVPPYLFYLMAYMGVDFFDTKYVVEASRRGGFITERGEIELEGLKELPCRCETCRNSKIGDMGFDSLLEHNYNLALKVLTEIREAVRGNYLRNLVEERVGCSASATAALRILDRNFQDILEKYTPVA